MRFLQFLFPALLAAQPVILGTGAAGREWAQLQPEVKIGGVRVVPGCAGLEQINFAVPASLVPGAAPSPAS